MKRLRAPLLLLTGLSIALLSPLGGAPRPAHAQGPCGDTYTVLPGDTLGDIAELCETTVTAILELNPEIEDPTRLRAGSLLRIPQHAEDRQPILAIDPTCGPPGSEITVLASGFPPNAPVEIGVGRLNQEYRLVGRLTSNRFGKFEARIAIPASAEPGRDWQVLAESSPDGGIKAVSTSFSVVRPVVDLRAASTYVVRAGDSLQSIAALYDRDPDSILEANPFIPSPGVIQVGQRLSIPAMEPGKPLVSITPTCGPPGTLLNVSARDFPPGRLVGLSIGRWGGEPAAAGEVRAGSSGLFSASVTLPAAARRGEVWVLGAEARESPRARSSSNLFSVTGPPDPNAPQIYVVRARDSLNELAARFDRSIPALLAANPDIENLNQIVAGSKLLIPASDERVSISPSTGPPGTLVQIVGRGFPPEAKVEVGLGRRETSYTLVETAITNLRGEFSAQATIPMSSQWRDRWVVVAALSRAGISRVAAVSNAFTVSGREPTPGEPLVTIWPLSGPPGTLLAISAADFPAQTPVSIQLGRQGQESTAVAETWTDVNGTFAAETAIPAGAAEGENWTVLVETLAGDQVTASSRLFTVVKTGAPAATRVRLFLISPGKGEVGCGDAVAAVERAIPETQAPLAAAIEELLSLKERIDPDSGYLNALYSSDLRLEAIEIIANRALLRLSGELRAGNACDLARIAAQLQETALQFPQIEEVEATINGVPIQDLPTQ